MSMQDVLTNQQATIKHLQKDFECLQIEATASKAQAQRHADLLDLQACTESALDLRPTLDHLCDSIQHLLRVERASIFVVDHEGQSLWLPPGTGGQEEEVRLPLLTGLLGHVAQKQEVVRLANAYKDPRFGREVDEKLRIVSRAVMCLPMVDEEGGVVGVLQVVNKEEGGAFSAEEEEWAMEIAQHVTGVVKRCLVFDKEKKGWGERLLGVKESLGVAGTPLEWPVKDVVTLCQAVSTQLCQMMGVNLATLMLVDHQEKEVYIPGNDGDLHVMVSGGRWWL